MSSRTLRQAKVTRRHACFKGRDLLAEQAGQQLEGAVEQVAMIGRDASVGWHGPHIAVAVHPIPGAFILRGRGRQQIDRGGELGEIFAGQSDFPRRKPFRLGSRQG